MTITRCRRVIRRRGRRAHRIGVTRRTRIGATNRPALYITLLVPTRAAVVIHLAAGLTETIAVEIASIELIIRNEGRCALACQTCTDTRNARGTVPRAARGTGCLDTHMGSCVVRGSTALRIDSTAPR